MLRLLGYTSEKTKKQLLYFALVAVFVISGWNVDAGKLIFDDKTVNAVIVLDPEAAPPAQYAARELQKYLKKASGKELEISSVPGSGVNIYVGEGTGTRAAGLNTNGLTYDGFRMRSLNGNIYLYGRDRREKKPLVDYRTPFEVIHIYNKKLDICAFGESGTLYAVYEFLRSQCGIRWYMPGDLGEVVPHINRLEVPALNYEKSPDFYYRTLWIGLFDQNDDVARWYRRAGFGAPFPVNICHSFYLMNFTKAHPEWHAMIDGKRDFNISCEGRGNLCLSAPGLLEAVVADANAYFDAHPEQYIYTVMPNDWFNRICDCPACQAQAEYDKPEYGKFSKYVWSFVNRVAKEVGKKHPDKFIGCCAYNTYAMIPEGMKFEPNVAVMFTKALYFRFNDFYRERNDVRCYKWAHTVKTLFCWDYYCWDDTNTYLTGLPIFFPHWIDTDIRNLKGISNGFYLEGGTYHYIHANPGINHPNFYILGRKLWDANANVDALLEDYYTNFYGPAKNEMKAFWTLAEKLWCDMSVKERGRDIDLTKTLYTPEKLDQLRGYCEAAWNKCPPGSDYAKRVELIQKHFYPYVDKMSNTRSRRPEYVVKRTTGSPVLDGRSNEALWRKANVLDFVRQNNAKPPAAATFVRMLHDDKNLYIAVNADEPNMNKLVAKAKTNDSYQVQPYIWNDDAIEIFIAPDRKQPKNYGQIILNTKGVFLDGLQNRGDPSWNSGVRSRTGKTSTGWCMEIVIPLANLAFDGKKIGTEWAMNLCRDRVAGMKERSAWAPPLSEDFHTPLRFGFVTLEQ